MSGEPGRIAVIDRILAYMGEPMKEPSQIAAIREECEDDRSRGRFISVLENHDVLDLLDRLAVLERRGEEAESALLTLQSHVRQVAEKCEERAKSVYGKHENAYHELNTCADLLLALLPSLAAAPDLSKESTVRLVEVLCNLLEQLTHDVGQISDGLLKLKAAILPSLAPQDIKS